LFEKKSLCLASGRVVMIIDDYCLIVYYLSVIIEEMSSKNKKINFSPAILKLETLLYQNI